MLVTRTNFEQILGELYTASVIALDTETTGLRPYHGDRLFSLILAVSPEKAFYFNFNATDEFSEDETLPRSYLKMLGPIFRRVDVTWVGHNLKFDIHILAQEEVFLTGTLYDTMVVMRLVDNDRFQYNLDSCAKDLLGEAKDDAVEKYIRENGLWSKVGDDKILHYDKVPRSIIVPYAEKDAILAFKLYLKMNEKLVELETKIRGINPSLPTVFNVLSNENRLLKTVFDMEYMGAKVDIPYCKAALEYYLGKIKEAEGKFKELTGVQFKASGKLFQDVFASDKDKWVYTKEKKSKKPRKKAFVPQPSFESDVLKTFSNPASRIVLDYRDAKSHADFFEGFLYHADKNGYIHADLQQSGTSSGRFSSSNPNLQNLSSDEDAGEETFPVRRAFIPNSKDHSLVSIDFQAQEYRVMISYAKETVWAEYIKTGGDVHEYSAKLMGVKRKSAKICNFGLLYGCGGAKLAAMLGISVEEGNALKDKYFEALPKIKIFLKQVANTATSRGFIVNWMGRVSRFKKITMHDGEILDLSYKAPNALIQGSSADITKVSMNRIHELLKGTKSSLTLSIHDEVVMNIHKDEAHLIKQIEDIMKESFPSDILKMGVSTEVGKNLYDMEKAS